MSIKQYVANFSNRPHLFLFTLLIFLMMYSTYMNCVQLPELMNEVKDASP